VNPQQPVLLEIVRECHFKAKPLVCRGKGCGVERPRSHARAVPRSTPRRWPECTACGNTEKPVQRQGCATCGGNKGDRGHYGAPKSFNVLASGAGSGNFGVYDSMKSAWQAIFLDLLKASGLEPCDSVFAEGEITFPDHREDRDQGNFRVILEKALGDALEEGGYLVSDNWDRYEFGQLSKREHPGESATRLTLFPDLRPERAQPEVPRPGEQLGLT
jgi:hypothetical protein